MALTGDADGAPLVPAANAADQIGWALRPFGLDAGVLAERAAIRGLTRSGLHSCGGGTRLLPAADGWVALTLSRPDDVAALPAVFEVEPERFSRGPADVGEAAPWDEVAQLIAERPAEEVAARTRLLGVPAGIVGAGSGAFTTEQRGPGRARGSEPPPPPRIVDLTSLWAGPLAASCLQLLGAEVIKVEDERRPDGARRGHPGFYDLLNAGKRSVALDLAAAGDQARLLALVMAADIVITSGRATALHRLGLDPDAYLAGGTDRTWVAITAHGWADDRVGFGDDVAATAGLVAWHPDGRPRFAGDAIADPIGGARAAAAARAAWHRGGRWFIDASLGGAAADTLDAVQATARAAAGPPWTIDGEPVARPEGRIAAGPAAELGADTDAVLAER